MSTIQVPYDVGTVAYKNVVFVVLPRREGGICRQAGRVEAITKR